MRIIKHKDVATTDDKSVYVIEMSKDDSPVAFGGKNEDPYLIEVFNVLSKSMQMWAASGNNIQFNVSKKEEYTDLHALPPYLTGRFFLSSLLGSRGYDVFVKECAGLLEERIGLWNSAHYFASCVHLFDKFNLLQQKASSINKSTSYDRTNYGIVINNFLEKYDRVPTLDETVFCFMLLRFNNEPNTVDYLNQLLNKFDINTESILLFKNFGDNVYISDWDSFYSMILKYDSLEEAFTMLNDLPKEILKELF